MDGNRFDSFTRKLATGVSRREILRNLGGSVLGGTLAVAGLRRSGAAPAGKVGICHHTGSATNPLVYIVVSANAAPAHAAHGDDVGVDLLTDVNNCGTCGNVCGGDACNTPVCLDGECTTTTVVCNDNNACTDDTCDPESGCVFTEISCDDGNACTDDSCDPASGCVHKTIVCDDLNPCTDDTCDRASGCVYTNNTAACTTEDGDEGTCSDGICTENPDPQCAGATCSTFTPCGPGGTCVCGTLASGGGLCVPGETSCGDLPDCDGDLGCPDGSLCFVDSCCGRPVCYPLDIAAQCDEAGFTSRANVSTESDGGPTFGGE